MLTDFSEPQLTDVYIGDIQGIVDSDTLPLNVSREMLQQHSSLKTIKKKLVRKALDMIRRIMDEDSDEKFGDDKTGNLFCIFQVKFCITGSWTGLCFCA
jgi:hypothetical protein